MEFLDGHTNTTFQKLSDSYQQCSILLTHDISEGLRTISGGFRGARVISNSDSGRFIKFYDILETFLSVSGSFQGVSRPRTGMPEVPSGLDGF